MLLEPLLAIPKVPKDLGCCYEVKTGREKSPASAFPGAALPVPLGFWSHLCPMRLPP